MYDYFVVRMEGELLSEDTLGGQKLQIPTMCFLAVVANRNISRDYSTRLSTLHESEIEYARSSNALVLS